ARTGWLAEHRSFHQPGAADRHGGRSVASRGRDPRRRGTDGAGPARHRTAERDDRAFPDRLVGFRVVRHDPERLRFEITAHDGAARAGRLHLAGGPVETPAFIPLATRGSVRSLTSAEVADLGYRMVLGNTFHLLLSPGPDRIAALGGLHGFMGW